MAEEKEQVIEQEEVAPETPKAEAAPATPVAEPRDEGGDQVANLDFILDIPLEVSVELGHTQMLVNDLLQLNQGSVVELDKLAGEPVEVMVNQKLIAKGEAVVINDKLGIRLTDIISPTERVKKLA